MKLDHKVFEKAAELVLKKHYGTLDGACVSIMYSTNKNLYKKFFYKIFRQDANRNTLYWYGSLTKEESYNRSNALLLCAELVKQGETLDTFI